MSCAACQPGCSLSLSYRVCLDVQSVVHCSPLSLVLFSTTATRYRPLHPFHPNTPITNATIPSLELGSERLRKRPCQWSPRIIMNVLSLYSFGEFCQYLLCVLAGLRVASVPYSVMFGRALAKPLTSVVLQPLH